MSRFFPAPAAGLVALAAVALSPAARATSIYDFTLTAAPNALAVIFGWPTELAFDLIGNDAAVGNNRVVIDNFSTDGVPALLGSVVLTDSRFFNEVTRSLTFGTYLNFTVTLTENNTGPGLDEFSFFILAPVTQGTVLPKLPTSDPTGADALFAIDLNGVEGGETTVFRSQNGGVSYQLTRRSVGPSAVPEAGSTVTLLLVSLAAMAATRVRLRHRESCSPTPRPRLTSTLGS